MFISTPQFEFHVPNAISQPGQTYWRALGMATRAPWFILSLSRRKADAPVETFLLTWDTDLTDLLRPNDADVQSLLLIVGDLGKDRGGCTSREIHEIWDGVDLEDDDSPCVVLVDSEATEYSGYFMERGKRVKRTNLVASVIAKTKRPNRASHS
jgi:hypothetical protein